ncbi:MAG: ABC transporter permease [Chloroflexota bacterium]
MSGTRTLAVARRILAGLRRDHRALGLVLVAPIVITLLLAWVIRGSEVASINVGLYAPNGQADQVHVGFLRAAAAEVPGGVDVTIEAATANDLDELRTWVGEGRVDVGVGLPGVQFGGAPTVTVITAGTDPATESGALAALQALVSRALGAATGVGPNTNIPTFRHETVFLSADADSLDILAPVFLGYFAYFFVFILTGISFLRERVGGTLERLLATPVTRAEIVVGYGIGFSVLATVQVILLTAFVLGRIAVPEIGPIGEWGIGLGVASAGSPLIVLALVLLLAIGAVNLGIFLSTFARSEFQIIQFIPIVIIPQGLLAGIFWPIDRLPEILAAIARVLPLTYAVDGLRGVILRGEDLAASTIQLDLAVLTAVAAVFVVLASVTIKREVA